MLKHYSTVISTLALVVALTGVGGAYAIGRNTVGGAQIKRNAVGASEVKRNAVRSSELRKNSVRKSEIGAGGVGASELGGGSVDDGALQTNAVGSRSLSAGSVRASELALPAPVQVASDAPHAAEVGGGYEKLADLGTIDKTTEDSKISVQWASVARASFASCVYQLRIDGQPAGEAGEAFVANSDTQSVSSSAVFAAGAGAHTVQVWARNTNGAQYPCAINPADVGVAQTVVIEELVQ